jgi:hypothetical protein
MDPRDIVGRHASKVFQEMPTWRGHLRDFIMALVELGRLAEARAAGQRLLALDPKHTVTIAARASPQQDPQFRQRYFAALRAVGISEQQLEALTGTALPVCHRLPAEIAAVTAFHVAEDQKRARPAP